MSGPAAELLRRFGLAVGWAVAAVAIAFGGAGVVGGVDHPAAARPELTWAADASVAPALERAAGDLAVLSDEVDELGSDGRGALGAIVGRDETQLNTFLAQGNTLVAEIESRAGALREALDDLPGFGPGAELRVGARQLARHGALVDALRSTEQLRSTWGVLADSGVTATKLTALLEAHDEAAFAATAAARKLDYAGAVKRVAEARARLADASKLRDQLRNRVDTSTLDEWLRRNEAYDQALLDLYTAFRDSKGRVTAAVRAAIRAERDARALLPKDARPIALIVAEIARGGATEAVLRIETARGDLAAAVDALAPDPAASPSP